MHVDRLIKWHDALLTMPEYFDMCHWGLFDTEGKICSVCAGGKAAAIGDFQLLGLGFATPLRRNIDGKIERLGAMPSYDESYGEAALAKFFGISVDEATSICYSRHYGKNDAYVNVTKELVASRIAALIRSMEIVYREPLPPAYIAGSAPVIKIPSPAALVRELEDA